MTKSKHIQKRIAREPKYIRTHVSYITYGNKCHASLTTSKRCNKRHCPITLMKRSTPFFQWGQMRSISHPLVAYSPKGAQAMVDTASFRVMSVCTRCLQCISPICCLWPDRKRILWTDRLLGLNNSGHVQTTTSNHG